MTFSFLKLQMELLKAAESSNILGGLSINDCYTLLQELQSAWDTMTASKSSWRRRLLMPIKLGLEIRDLRNLPEKQRAKTILGCLSEPEYVQLTNIIGRRLSSMISEFNARGWAEATGTVVMKEKG